MKSKIKLHRGEVEIPTNKDEVFRYCSDLMLRTVFKSVGDTPIKLYRSIK